MVDLEQIYLEIRQSPCCTTQSELRAVLANVSRFLHENAADLDADHLRELTQSARTIVELMAYTPR